jgi:hypothetical protein
VTSKYVTAFATDDDGTVTVTIQGINAAANGKFVTLIPTVGGVTATTANFGFGLNGWVCGGTGTTLDKKYLPGPCRGG